MWPQSCGGKKQDTGASVGISPGLLESIWPCWLHPPTLPSPAMCWCLSSASVSIISYPQRKPQTLLWPMAAETFTPWCPFGLPQSCTPTSSAKLEPLPSGLATDGTLDTQGVWRLVRKSLPCCCGVWSGQAAHAAFLRRGRALPSPLLSAPHSPSYLVPGLLYRSPAVLWAC